jgi:hypothetical protein
MQTTLKRIYSGALESGKAVSSIIPALRAYGLDPGDPALASFGDQDYENELQELADTIDDINKSKAAESRESGESGALFESDSGSIF